ncbi:MAG: amidase [Proteobacteria bacterium]|nr:amidase [Pseudomonadota bacterium]
MRLCTRSTFQKSKWLRSHAAAARTATAVRLLLDAGADMIGKTFTDEMAYSLTGENVHYGTPVNPRGPERIPGGSSNGSVAAVAGGLVDFVLGTDCGGSIRLPASYCGIYGVRPSHGRVSTEGVLPFAPSFDVVGWFARAPDVFEAVGRVLLQDEGPVQRPRRLLTVADAFGQVEPRVADAVQPAVAALAATIAPPEAVLVSPDGLRAWFETFRVLQAAEIWENHGAWVSEWNPTFGPGVRERFAWAATVDSDEVARCRQIRAEIADRLRGLILPGDVLCLPTASRGAPLKGTPTDIIEVSYRQQAMALLCVAGLGGMPQISLPVASLDGLPLGLSILGSNGSDLQLLSLATELGTLSGGEADAPVAGTPAKK